MKFSWKVFFCTATAIICSFAIGGNIILTSVFQSAQLQENLAAQNKNELLCFTFQTTANSLPETTTSFPQDIISQIINRLDSANQKVSITSEYNTSLPSSFTDILTPNTTTHQIVSNETEHYIQTVSCIKAFGTLYYLESIHDISRLYENQRHYIRLYQWTLLMVAGIGSALAFFLCRLLSRRLKALSKTTAQIAGGNFSIRVSIRSKDEIGQFASDFNQMADVVEEKIHELEDTAEKQSDFIASFAHELKTPLTSIIGYADMLRSYDLPADQRYLSANYIFREGKRLEALSLHLMDLIVLEKQEFPLISFPIKPLLSDVECILQPLLQKYSIQLQIHAEQASVRIEPDLLKTLLYNLIDNSCKASQPGDTILLSGTVQEGSYLLSVKDHGKGIPPEEIQKVTEPFYMVDKSRARQQNGAGIGLALCYQIAKIHHSQLVIQSQPGDGTTVAILLEVIDREA